MLFKGSPLCGSPVGDACCLCDKIQPFLFVKLLLNCLLGYCTSFLWPGLLLAWRISLGTLLCQVLDQSCMLGSRKRKSMACSQQACQIQVQGSPCNLQCQKWNQHALHALIASDESKCNWLPESFLATIHLAEVLRRVIKHVFCAESDLPPIYYLLSQPQCLPPAGGWWECQVWDQIPSSWGGSDSSSAQSDSQSAGRCLHPRQIEFPLNIHLAMDDKASNSSGMSLRLISGSPLLAMHGTLSAMKDKIPDQPVPVFLLILALAGTWYIQVTRWRSMR